MSFWPRNCSSWCDVRSSRCHFELPSSRLQAWDFKSFFENFESCILDSRFSKKFSSEYCILNPGFLRFEKHFLDHPSRFSPSRLEVWDPQSFSESLESTNLESQKPCKLRNVSWIQNCKFKISLQ